MTDLETPSTAHTYSRGTAIFEHAARSFGATLPTGQVTEWQELIRGAFTLDSILDSPLPEGERESAFTAHLTEMVATIGADWDASKADRIVDAAMNVKEIAHQKRYTVSANRLGRLAIREGLETARFLQLEDRIDDGTIAFNSWLGALLPFGVAIDTAVDLPQDFHNGLTRVKPLARNRLIVASHGLRFANTTVAHTPVSVFASLARAARVITHDVHKDSPKNTRE